MWKYKVATIVNMQVEMWVENALQWVNCVCYLSIISTFIPGLINLLFCAGAESTTFPDSFARSLGMGFCHWEAALEGFRN